MTRTILVVLALAVSSTASAGQPDDDLKRCVQARMAQLAEPWDVATARCQGIELTKRPAQPAPLPPAKPARDGIDI